MMTELGFEGQRGCGWQNGATKALCEQKQDELCASNDTDTHSPARICLHWGSTHCTLGGRQPSTTDLLPQWKWFCYFSSTEFFNQGFIDIWGWKSLFWINVLSMPGCLGIDPRIHLLMPIVHCPPCGDTQNTSRHWPLPTGIVGRRESDSFSKKITVLTVQILCYQFSHILLVVLLRTSGLQLCTPTGSKKSWAHSGGKITTSI